LIILFRPFGFLALLRGKRGRQSKELKIIDKKGYGHLCLREESKKTKGPEEDSQNRLRSSLSET
jgi:hypothetical protein